MAHQALTFYRLDQDTKISKNYLFRMWCRTLSHSTVHDQPGELELLETKNCEDMSNLNVPSSFERHKDMSLSRWTYEMLVLLSWMYSTSFVSTPCFSFFLSDNVTWKLFWSHEFTIHSFIDLLSFKESTSFWASASDVHLNPLATLIVLFLHLWSW